MKFMMGWDLNCKCCMIPRMTKGSLDQFGMTKMEGDTVSETYISIESFLVAHSHESDITSKVYDLPCRIQLKCRK